MILTKDNYEMIMFDLLEGNIPEGDRASLLEQITKDPFFAQEWKLFQSTVLVPDESIVFPAKSSLLKKENTRIIPMRTWISVAVAASLIFAFFVYPNINQTDSDLGTTLEETLVQETPTPKSSVEPSVGAEPTLAVDQPSTPPSNAPNNYASNTPVEYPVVREEPVEEEVQISRMDPMKSREFIASFTSDIPQKNNPNLSINDPYYQITDVTSSRPARIMSTAIVSLARLNNPKVNVTPDWSKKQLDIEFESSGYYAMASVTPFNKQ